MDNENIGFEQLIAALPAGWEAKAKELGALKREREIKNPYDLLRLVFLYLTEGKSFGGTAALLRLGGICSISKKAVFTRFQKCAQWLRWMSKNIYRNNKAVGDRPEWLGDREVYIVDAGDEPVYGSDKTDYRLHYAIGLFDMKMKEMTLTETDRGEQVSNFKTFTSQDIVIGDRAYCSISGIKYLLERNSGFLFRYETKCFLLYNHQGKKVNIFKFFGELKPGSAGERTLYYEQEGEYRPLRLCALRKTKTAGGKRLDALEQRRTRKNTGKTLSAEQAAHNQYVIIATSITGVPPELILGLYRQKCHMESILKRFKSSFKCHQIPVHVEQSALASFYGKLFLAVIDETRQKSSKPLNGSGRRHTGSSPDASSPGR